MEQDFNNGYTITLVGDRRETVWHILKGEESTEVDNSVAGKQ